MVRKYLWHGALVLVTLGATGCVVIDAEKLELRQSATIRSEECVIRQGLSAAAPATAEDGDIMAELVGGR